MTSGGAERAVRSERWIDADGLFVHSVEWEDPGRSGRAPVLLVHGLGGSTTNWLPVGGPLAERLRTRVTAIDLAGFGRTRTEGRPASLGTNGRLLEAVLRDGPPTVVVGNSMGGALAVGLAARHPELVGALVLVDPAVPRPQRTAKNLTRAARFAAVGVPRLGGPIMSGRARALGPERLVDATLRIVLANPEHLDPTVRAEMVAQATERLAYPEAGTAYAQAAGSLFRYLAHPMRADLAAVRAPTLIVHGARDRLVPLSFVRTLVSRRPEWELRVFGESGHAPMLEEPTRFVDTLTDWLRARRAVV